MCARGADGSVGGDAQLDGTDSSPGDDASTRNDRDRGFSLVEVVVTLALAAMLVIPLTSAVFTATSVSSVARSAAQVETALVNAADRVNGAPSRCDYTIYAQAAVQTQGWQPDRASVVVEHYVPGATPDVAGTWQAGGCIGAAPTDLLVQRVTVRVTTPDDKVTRSIQVVKSDV